MNSLEQKAQAFIEEAWKVLGKDHPLPHLFAGLMLAYYADESDLKWIVIAMRPWFDDSEKKMVAKEQEELLALLWIMAASRAARESR